VYRAGRRRKCRGEIIPGRTILSNDGCDNHSARPHSVVGFLSPWIQESNCSGLCQMPLCCDQIDNSLGGRHSLSRYDYGKSHITLLIRSNARPQSHKTTPSPKSLVTMFLRETLVSAAGVKRAAYPSPSWERSPPRDATGTLMTVCNHFSIPSRRTSTSATSNSRQNCLVRGRCSSM